LRKVGLWLYKREMLKSEPGSSGDIEQESANLFYAKTDSENIFALTEPYSDEIEIKKVMNRIINKLEIEEQESLKDDQPILNKQTSKSAFNPNKATKRKLNEISENRIFHTQIDEREHKRKLFDPLNEHFNWCPWLQCVEVENKPTSLTTNEFSLLSSTHHSRTKTRLINKNVCHLFFEVVNTINKSQAKRTKMERITTDSHNLKTISEDYKTSESERNLINKVKSIKSLLIDCASQLIDK